MVSELTPCSEATASTNFHWSEISDMSSTIGQSVRHVKAHYAPDNSARDYPDKLSKIRGMAQENGWSRYKREFTARIRRLRKEKGWTQAQMATALGVSTEAYRKYEGRTPLPHALLERFALVTERTVHYLVTGHDPAMPAPTPTRTVRRLRA